MAVRWNMLSQPDSETCQTSRGVNCGRCCQVSRDSGCNRQVGQARREPCLADHEITNIDTESYRHSNYEHKHVTLRPTTTTTQMELIIYDIRNHRITRIILSKLKLFISTYAYECSTWFNFFLMEPNLW